MFQESFKGVSQEFQGEQVCVVQDVPGGGGGDTSGQR